MEESYAIIHEDSEDCICGPTIEPVKDEEDGSISWLIIHHRLDGRT